MRASCCHRCGASLQLRGYRAIALLKQNQFSRTLLAIEDSAPPAECVIQQSWGDQGETQAKLPLQALSRLAQIPALLECFEQDGVCYLVQEYIRGDSLAQTIAAKGQFSPVEVWQVLENLLPVLQQIHAHDVIHGDIKPENIRVYRLSYARLKSRCQQMRHRSSKLAKFLNP